MKILIFDLKFAFYSYHSTLFPSTPTMMISGYHKALRDTVVFTTEIPSFALYDVVYIVKDQKGLAHNPEWLLSPNVILVGPGWNGLETYDRKWENYPLDITIYHKWLESRLEKYPKYNKDRVKHFYRKPVLLYKKAKWFLDHEGENILVCDLELIKKDPQCEKLSQLSASTIEFLYPLEINAESVFAVCSFIKKSKGIVIRERLWGIINGIPTKAEQDHLIEAWNKYKIGRLFQWKLSYTAHTFEEWYESVESVIDLVYNFKENAGKRIFIYPYDWESLKYSRLFQELKRWTGSKAVFNHNNFMDYLILDSIRSYDLIADFIVDPHLYVANKKMGSNKLGDIVACLEEYPELLDVITKKMPGRFGS